MLHGPAKDSGPDPARDYKARLGVWMFIAYCVLYGGFVFANVFREGEAMQNIVFMGLNLAVVYGFGLIVVALVMAVIYNSFCTAKERKLANTATQQGKQQ